MKNSYARRLLRIALLAATCVAAGRIVQLAATNPPTPSRFGRGQGEGSSNASDSPSPQPSPTGRGSVSIPLLEKQARDAEIARLYAACPMAAVVDLDTVARDPARVDTLLPPYRPTAHREDVTPLEPAVPRIRYPVAVGEGRASRVEGREPESGPVLSAPLRVAQVQPIARAIGARPDLAAVAAEPSPNPARQRSPQASLKGRGTSADWLIDPSEWYAPNAVGGVSGAELPASDSAIPNGVENPGGTIQSASETPPTIGQAPIDDGLPPTETPPPVQPIFTPPQAAGQRTTATPPASGIAHPASSPVDPHLELFAKNAYPSARECAQCHEEIYHDWSISAHAYAAVSPMFQKFEQKLNDLSQGTVGYFCMRCHAPVATALGASRDQPLWTLPEVAREGITCIVCHRVQYVYGKSNGERRIEPGNVFAPVFGGIGGEGVAETIHRKDEFKVKTSPDEAGPGQNMHVAGIYFEPLTRSEFCTPCHQVAVHPGIKLEVVWEQYRASPACKKGIQCQDCHMGRVPGLPLGYEYGPVAKVAGKTVNDNRRKSNHIFYGPNYPIAHPGVFPFHLKADRWTMEQWLTFDWRAGWGTEEFEKAVADGRMRPAFPPVWAEADDRRDAREIIDENFKKIVRKRDIRIQVMENGSHVDGPFFDSPLCRGQDLNFHYVITNKNEGHNLLTASLGAQPQLWANVVLTGPDGRRLWESGYLDSYGDLANIHSVDVRNKRLPYDFQLFNLQTMFLIQGATGTDREFFVPVNLDVDQLAFIRPGVQPITNINHPPGIRMESRSLAPLGSRTAFYHVPARLLQQPGRYRLSFRMRSRSEPPYFMRFCDATEEMLRAENEWMIDVHPMTVEFEVR